MARRGESTKHTGSRTRKLYSRVRARSERITQPPPRVSSSPYVVAAIATVDEPFDLAVRDDGIVAAPPPRDEPSETEARVETVDAEAEQAREDLLRLAETGSDAPPPVEANELALPPPPPTPDFSLVSEDSRRDEERPVEMPSERPVTFELEHHESGFFSVADEGGDEQDDDATRPAARPYVGNERRRRRAAQYVSGVLAFCGLVALAGIASRAAADPHTSISGSAMALSNFDVRAPRSGAPAAAAPAPKVDDVPAPAEAAEAPEAPPAPIADAPAPVASAAPSASASAAPTAAAPADGDAKAEKKAAQQALERGKVADAIVHGERSVELDPTDGEAWLILGAARQEKGNPLGAREAYGKCLKLGTRGPKNECAAMLR